MSNLIQPARDLVYELLKGVNLKQEEYVRKILRMGYQDYCKRVVYGHTSSGYKAWRKACNEFTGKQPKKKKSKTNRQQMELF